MNILVEGGSSVRLKTAGKYCTRDILVTAEGEDLGNLMTFIKGESKITDVAMC